MENKKRTLEMSVEQAKDLYKNEPSLRSWLEENFDKKDLKPFHYTDIKTFEDACNKLGITAKTDVDFGNPKLNRGIIATYKLQVIFEAINNGWEPDWDNANEDKYYPWFNMSSVSFDYSGYAYWFSVSVAGSRLCTYNKDFSDYIGKTFEDIYREAFLIDK